MQIEAKPLFASLALVDAFDFDFLFNIHQYIQTIIEMVNWLNFVKDYREKHPELSYKEALTIC